MIPSLKVQIQGQGTVSADNLNTYEQTCNTASQLRSFIGVSGIQVFIRGGAAIADGLQGAFYWNATGTAADDNGITTIKPNGVATGEWTRLTPFITAYSYQIPLTGFSITVPARTSALILNPAGTLSTGTIVMPAAPTDGFIVRFSSTQIVTTLTVSANSGQSIMNAPTAFTAGGAFGYIYDTPISTWFKI